MKVWRRQDNLPCKKPLWLLISKDSESNEVKYSLCNASEDTSFDKLAMLILLLYQIKLNKMYKISLSGVILILKYHNPLRRIDAWEIARILNQDNELRMRARISRLRGS